jgi:hypothetical protein
MCRSGVSWMYNKWPLAGVIAAVLLAAGPLLAATVHVPPARSAPKRIYKVDSVIATLTAGHLFITAKGAVHSGGWKGAMLKLVRSPSDPRTIVVDFLATPPPANAPVIQGLLPISANVVVPMRRGVVTVRAAADANEMTTQILKQEAPDELPLRRLRP